MISPNTTVERLKAYSNVFERYVNKEIWHESNKENWHESDIHRGWSHNIMTPDSGFVTIKIPPSHNVSK
jgi:hypothetical protein